MMGRLRSTVAVLAPGLAYELSIEGDTIVKGKYSDGMPHGKWFFKIGDEYEIGELYYGAKTGEWLTYFYPEMKIKCKTEYIDGKKSGKHKCYYLNKKYREIGEYSNNNKTGKCVITSYSIHYTKLYELEQYYHQELLILHKQLGYSQLQQ